MTERDDRIREIAYFLWLEEGRPEDQAERHWQAAEILFDSEPVERKRTEGEPPGDPAAVSQEEPVAPPSRRDVAGSSTSQRRLWKR